MDNTKMNDLQIRNHISELLAKKRNYTEEIKNLVSKYEYVVFYGVGVIFNGIVETWNGRVKRTVDFCCDSDSSKWGRKFCGIKCISPEKLMGIKDRCLIFVTVGNFKSSYDFLTKTKFPSVNVIYRYDFFAADFLTTQKHDNVVDSLCKTYLLLSDQQSIKVFKAIVERVLTRGKDSSIMANVCSSDEYFSTDIINLSHEECFVDAGAFDGDTIRGFILRAQSKFDCIFSFEVDAINFKALQESVQKMPEKDRIKIFNLGVWDSECDITYSIGESQSTVGALGEGKGHVIPLDNVLKNERVTFIKMDIEGAEPQALRGAQNIIRTQRPKLAICVYHDFRHLWEIPLYIKSLVPEYKIYLRHHTNLEYETVCYAVL